MSQAPLIPGTFPLGYCYPSDPQLLIAQAFSLGHAEVSDNLTGVTFSETDPGPEGHGRPWFKPSTGKLWYWNTTIGKWVSVYSPAPGPITLMWSGTEPQLATYDGGNPVVLGAETYTGPFWEIDHDFDGRSPMGPGAISGSFPAKTLGLGEPFGEGAHTQTQAELVQHTHRVEFSDQPPGEPYTHWDFDSAGQNGSINEPVGHDSGAGTNSVEMIAMAAATAAIAANVTHPVNGIWIIKRTARIYYTL